MTLHKLKVAARQHEQREEWHAAIELYRQAIREAEGTTDSGDPTLYNRVGDLAHKEGDNQGACEAWEQAATRYGDLGFFNNAIALCGKILRLEPQRLRTYLELARFQARKRVLYDTRANLKTYLDRMTASGRVEDARKALEHFAEEFPGWHDLDVLLDELLGRERHADGPRGGAESGGKVPRDLVFIDTGPMVIERASEPAELQADGGPLLEIPVTADLEFEPRSDDSPLAGLQSTSTADPDVVIPDASSVVEGLVNLERTSVEVGMAAPIEGLDTGPGEDISTPAGGPTVEGLEQTSLAEPAQPEIVAPAEAGNDDDSGVVFIDAGPTVSAVDIPQAADDDPLGQRIMANALLEHGDRAGGITALDRALSLYQSQEEWLHAYQVATELIQAEPRAIARHQTRVEIAARMRDASRLCEAYVELGDALVREGGTDKAVAVYRRVLELDERHERARAALRAMAPETISADAGDGFVDFGAMVVDDAGPRSTRMRTETPDVQPDEEDTFKDALAEFKRALDQNIAVEDHQAHYDLGIAFKEMGLLDEAISEFQKALRAPEVRLRTSEALGEVFFDQGRPAVAEAVLRGVEKSPEGDSDKIGVLYWLGRALEAQGKGAEALAYYQRIMAVDVTFRDASERLSHLSEAPGA